MANIQIGTNLRNCKITLAAEFYQPWGVLFSFQNNTTDVINSSSFTDTSMPGGMTVYDVNGSGIFSSVNVNGFTSYGTLDATTFDIPNDKDYIVSTLDDGFTTATYEPLTSNIQIPITKNGKTTLATKGTKNVEDIDINVDIAPTIQSLSITPSETSQTFNAANVDGYKPVNVSAIQTETPSVDLSLASGNQTVNASSGKYIKSLTIKKPSTLIGSNIKKNVVIAGITGTYEFKTQNKTFTPTQTGGSVTADSGYDGLGVVTVNPVPLGNKTDVPLNFYNQNTGTIVDTQNIYSDENKFMTWASVSRPSTLIAENIKKDINIGGVVGTLESGGSSFPLFTGLFRLTTPSISLKFHTITITTINDNKATSYDIYKDGTLLANITTTSVDLSTLITTTGTYAITVKAKADGYADSNASNEVSYTYIQSNYSLTITPSWSETMSCPYGTMYTWIKMNSAPTNASDFDYIVDSSAVETTVNNVGKIYIWGDSTNPVVNGTSTIIGGSYSSATEITLTQNTTITAYGEYIEDPGGPCCFLPNTLVDTVNGMIKIEDVKVGDLVSCYNVENKEYIYNNVTKVIKNINITELATLELENGTKVQFNSYHPILTQEGWKSLTNFNDYPALTENDVMINGEKIKTIKVEIFDTPLIGYNLVVDSNNNFIIEGGIIAEGGKR